jgi:membrane protein
VRGITVTPGYKIPHGTAAAPLQAADDFQRRHRWLAFPVAVVKKYGEDQAGQRAAQSAMNGIWNVPRRRYPNFLLRRLRGLAWLFILGGGLLLASVVSGFAAAADTAWSGPAGVAASTPVNMLLFLVGFRVLTVRDVPLRQLLPGAVLAALAWALLQWLGGWYVARQLSRASATYGTFALVIGLLSWLYLASTVTLLAAELNVVRARRLWPRSLAPPPLGRPDERALEGLAKQEERLPDQRVEVSFGDTDDGAGRLDQSS